MDLRLVAHDEAETPLPAARHNSVPALGAIEAGLIDAYWRAANCLSVGQLCLYDNPLPREPLTRSKVNVVVAGKRVMPQWLTMDAAIAHCAQGIGIWGWASSDHDGEPDVIMACCGDTPTLEVLGAVSILRDALPEIRVRVVNVVDLLKLQSSAEHPHGLSDADYDSLFTRDRPVILAFHGYPGLVQRLTHARTNRNMHVHGYQEEGTITTAFDIRVQNGLDRFHLVIDAVDQLPQTGSRGAYLQQAMRDRLAAHTQYIDRHGQDLPEIRNWSWTPSA